MNDNDMNEMIEKAQEMIKNNQVPDDLKNMAAMLQNSGMDFGNSTNQSTNAQVNSSNTYSEQNNNINNNYNNANQTSNNIPNIDMATLMKMQSMISKLKSADNDDMSKLLISLKPYMREEKKTKIDEYINLIKMGKMAQVLEALGGNNK